MVLETYIQKELSPELAYFKAAMRGKPKANKILARE